MVQTAAHDRRHDQEYSRYLDLDAVLQHRATFTDTLAEHSFIMVHQATELYIDDANRHLAAAKALLRRNDVPSACDALKIVATDIDRGWMVAWTRLLEMKPHDFQTIVRPNLASASGIQSSGHRMFEYHQGVKSGDLAARDERDQEIHVDLKRLRSEASVYDEAIALLARRGFEIDRGQLDRDKSLTYKANSSVELAWLEIYRRSEEYPELYRLAECFVDIDHKFQIWRFCHFKTVQRHIGRKRGTHGTSGVGYLGSLVDREFYPELWELRTSLAQDLASVRHPA